MWSCVDRSLVREIFEPDYGSIKCLCGVSNASSSSQDFVLNANRTPLARVDKVPSPH